MTGELIGRLLMVLVGFVLAMLGIITFVHSGEHQTLGILIMFSGVVSMFGGCHMPNKHFCQGPDCHTRITQDRFLKSRGVIRGRYASTPMDHQSEYYKRGKYFCSTACEYTWLDAHMESIEQGRPIEFIRHRRESGGYEKQTNEYEYGYREGTYTRSEIKRVDNRTEIE